MHFKCLTKSQELPLNENPGLMYSPRMYVVEVMLGIPVHVVQTVCLMQENFLQASRKTDTVSCNSMFICEKLSSSQQCAWWRQTPAKEKLSPTRKDSERVITLFSTDSSNLDWYLSG